MRRGIVATSPPAEVAGATAFYAFGDALQMHEPTQAFGAGPGMSAVDAAQQDALVDEARRSILLHQRLFEELAAAFAIREPLGA